MLTLQELSVIVNQEIDGLYKSRQPEGLYLPIDYALSAGGKRIRPVLCLMATQMFSESYQKALKPAIGLEVFHNFTLLHDDIMDKAELRRNKPTVHKKWDENTAILSGDAMMIEAYEYFFDLEPELLAKVLPVFNKTALEVCEGQQFDMNFETQENVSEEEYLNMIRLKTAVLLAGALKIGAQIGGASPEDADKLYQFGIEAGLAFQLQDDYLDTFGNETTFGKRIGGDIVENKKTYLLIQALKSDKDHRLKAILNDTQLKDADKIQAVSAFYKEHQVDVVTQTKILAYYKSAFGILDSINLEDGKKEPLKAFLEKLQSRIF